MKSLIAVVACLFSVNAFCCKPATQMKGESLFYSGVLNLLKGIEQYSDFEIKSITKENFEYSARIMNEQDGKCIELALQSYGTGSCDDFTAKIISQKDLDFSNCQ